MIAAKTAYRRQDLNVTGRFEEKLAENKTRRINPASQFMV